MNFPISLNSHKERFTVHLISLQEEPIMLHSWIRKNIIKMWNRTLCVHDRHLWRWSGHHPHHTPTLCWCADINNNNQKLISNTRQVEYLEYIKLNLQVRQFLFYTLLNSIERRPFLRVFFPAENSPLIKCYTKKLPALDTDFPNSNWHFIWFFHAESLWYIFIYFLIGPLRIWHCVQSQRPKTYLE